MGNAALASGSLEEGMKLDEESLRHLRGDDRYSRYPRSDLGYVAMLVGDYERGADLMADVLDFDREVGDVEGIANDLGLLAIAAAHLGRDDEAVRLMREAASLAARLGHTQVLVNRVLPAEAIVFGRRQEEERAVAALAAARACATARGQLALGPLGEAVCDEVWNANASALQPEVLARVADDVNRRLRDGDINSYVNETLSALD